MISFIFIVFCAAAGYTLRRTGLMQAGSYKGVNAWILYIALPACFLRYLPEVHWVKETLLPCLAPVGVWMGAWLLATFYSKKYPISKQTRGAMKLAAGLSNTAFLGFIAVYYNDEAIHIAVLFDQTSFILLSSIGLITAIREAGQQPPPFPVLVKKLFRFPPLIACLLALFLPLLSVDYSFIYPLLDKITVTIGPLALFSIGSQLEFNAIKKWAGPLSAAVTYKVLLAPLLILIVALLSGIRGPIAQISVFEAAMPTLATAVVLADEYELNPQLASLITGMSLVVSFITTGMWWWVLRMLG